MLTLTLMKIGFTRADAMGMSEEEAFCWLRDYREIMDGSAGNGTTYKIKRDGKKPFRKVNTKK